MRTLEAIKKLAKKLCSTATDTELDKVQSIDEAIDYIATNYYVVKNMLPAPVTLTKTAGTTVTAINQSYKLGIAYGKTYRVRYKYLGVEYSRILPAKRQQISSGGVGVPAIGKDRYSIGNIQEDIKIPADGSVGALTIFDTYNVNYNNQVTDNSCVVYLMTNNTDTTFEIELLAVEEVSIDSIDGEALLSEPITLPVYTPDSGPAIQTPILTADWVEGWYRFKWIYSGVEYYFIDYVTESEYSLQPIDKDSGYSGPIALYKDNDKSNVNIYLKGTSYESGAPTSSNMEVLSIDVLGDI